MKYWLIRLTLLAIQELAPRPAPPNTSFK